MTTKPTKIPENERHTEFGVQPETEQLPERHRAMLLQHHAKFGCGAEPGANVAECLICRILMERPCGSTWKRLTFEGKPLELTCRMADGHAGDCRARVAREVLGTANAVEFVWPKVTR